MDWFLYDNGLRHERFKHSESSRSHSSVSKMFKDWSVQELTKTDFVRCFCSLFTCYIQKQPRKGAQEDRLS